MQRLTFRKKESFSEDASKTLNCMHQKSLESVRLKILKKMRTFRRRKYAAYATLGFLLCTEVHYMCHES